MKNNLFKKSMAVFLSVLMILSCWVWVPGEHNHAEAVSGTVYGIPAINNSHYQSGTTNAYGTPVFDGTLDRWFEWKNGNDWTRVYYPSEIYLDKTESLEGAGYYFNVNWAFGSSASYRILLGANVWGDNAAFGSYGNGRVMTMNNIFSNYAVDASTPTGMGTGADSGVYKRTNSDTSYDLRIVGYGYSDQGSDGFDNNGIRHEKYVLFRSNSTNPRWATIYLKGNPNESYIGKRTEYNTSGDSYKSYGFAQRYSSGWKVHDDGNAQFQSKGSSSSYMEGEWIEMQWFVTIYDKQALNNAITKSNSIYSQNEAYANYITTGLDNYMTQHQAAPVLLKTRATNQTALDNQTTALENAAEALRFAASNAELLTAISQAEAILNSNAYTKATKDAVRTAYNAAVSSSYYNGVTSYSLDFSDSSTWNAGQKADNDQKAIDSLTSALNAAIAGATNRKFDVTYENMFFFTDWAESASGVIGTSAKGTMTYDIDAGTITINNNGANTQTNPNDHYTAHGFGNGHYNMTLVPGETYTFEYTTSGGTGDQVHIFFYDDNGNAVANKANSGNPFAHAYGTGRGTHTISFTAPENATKASFRFGSTVLGDSITFSNIYMYSHTRGDYAHIADWTSRPNRTVFEYNEALGSVTLDVPVRPGYTFNGWWVDSINVNGTKDEGEQVTDGNGTVVADLQNFGIAQNWVLYSEWTVNKYTVTWENEDGTVLETDTDVEYGTTPTYDGETPTKAADAQYTYTFKGWSPEVTEVTGDVTYTAVYEKTLNSFTVTWKFADGKETTESYAYGATPTAPANTASYNDANGHHTYSWPALSAVTGNVTYEETLFTAGHTPGAAATCQAPQTCTVCGVVLAEKLAHTEEIIPAVPATCTTPGKTEGKKCSICGEILVAQQDTELAAHTEVDVPAVAATCTSTGLTAGKKCSVCGTVTVAQTETSMLDHVMGDWSETKAPTCITAGEKTRKCANCTHTETEAVAATGVHVYGKWTNNDAKTHSGSCTSDTACTAVTTEAHTKSDTVKAVSSTYHQYKCEKCDAYGAIINGEFSTSMREECYIVADTTFTQIEGNAVLHTETCKCGNTKTDAHTWAGWVADPENKTDENGQMSNTCSECGYKKTTDCTYIATNTENATCTVDGYRTWECSDCGNGYTEVLKAPGHTEGEVQKENVQAATCTADGSYEAVVYCTVCDTELSRKTETVPAAGHDFGEITPADAATCVATGNEAYKQCTVCSKFFAADADVKSEDAKDSADAFTTGIDSTNHETTTSHEQTHPTCLNVGYTAGVFCEDCDKWISGHEEIDAIGHKNKEHHVKVDATCISTGTIEYWSCPDCGKNFSDEACTQEVTELTIAIDADAHKYGDWTETKAPTCSEAGEKQRVCVYDATHVDIETVAIDATAHKYGDWTETKAPTCSTEGEKQRVCEYDAAHVDTEAIAIVPDAHNYSVEITARPELVDGTWTDGTYTYTCKYDESHTKTEAALRADYAAFDEAVEELNELLSNEKLTDEGKTSVNNALDKADDLAKNLVVSEQPQIDELVTELNRIKAAAEQIIANSGKPQPITEAVSGLKVQFLEADDIVAIESLQLNAGGGFDTARLRLTNNNKDLPITVVRVESDKTATYLDTANTPATNSTGSFVIDIDGSKDLYIAAPASFNETGVITYTVTYNVGSAAEGYLMNADGTPVEFQTKAYIYVKGAAFTPYHLMDERAAWPLTATSKWQHYFEAVNYGDFELISDNSASKFSDNLEVGTSNFGFRHDAYDYAEDGCQAGCENGNYTTGDAHAATYRYYIDTSLAPTWEDAGFRVRITEKAESVYENAPLKYVRLAVDQTYLDGISGNDKTFTTTFVPSASSNVPNKTWTVTSTGTLAVEAYENPDRSEYLFGEHKNKDGFDETSAYVNFSGSIPVGVNDAKMMFSPRIEFNGKSSSESVTMTSHIWIVSYDKGALREAVNAAEQAAYNRDYYASAEWDAYNTALRNAKEVLGKAETTQSEVNEKLAALNTAVAALTATEARAKYVLTLTDSIRESADRNGEATSTQVSYFLLAKGSDFTPALDADVIALDTINKYDDAATLTINGTTEHTYNYWYIDYSDIDEALEAADTILENPDDYSEEFIEKVTEAKEALEEVKNETKTNTPESQATVDEAIKAVTDLTGHTCDENVAIPAVAPTCTDTGLTVGAKCSSCGKITVEQEVVDELGHDWKATTYNFAADGSTCTATRECQRTDCGVTETATATITSAEKTPATCTVMGWTTYTATFTETWAAVQYKDVQDIAINENNHDGDTYTKDEDIVAGTCISEKTWNEVTYCSDCDAKLSSEAKTGEIDSTNHENTKNHEQTYPTCLDVGYTAGVFCEDCDKWISGHEEIPATNHENKVHHTKVDATCMATGTIEYWSCPDCNKNFSDEECTTVVTDLTIEINPYAHSWNDWTQTTAPTCSAAGEDTRTCKHNAEHKETRPVAIVADAHKWETEYTTDIDPECETPGSKSYHCEYCDAINEASKTEIPATDHDYDMTKSESNLTRPALVDGSWTQGYYTYTCKNDANHTTTEKVDRATYTYYEAAKNALEALKNTDLTAEAKAAIQDVLDANDIADNLIASEQDTVDSATANLKDAFEQYKGSLKTYTVTFVVDGVETETTVISGNDATAPTDVKKAYDETYHYEFAQWDTDFTNVTSDLTVTAEFTAIEHNYTTHTYKDADYHTDKCACGYEVDAEHTESTKASCLAPAHCDVCASDYGVALGHKDENKDHACDNGCDVYQGEHKDDNLDHVCDYGCSEAIGDCEDTDHDHHCDYGCDKYFGTHADTDLDHVCDYGCSEAIGDCVDADKDHDCDYGCDKYFGTHEDTNKDHACDYGCAEAIGDCEDTDHDHACDYGCDKVYGEHEDANKDHACDYGCSVAFGTCEDADKDHACDYGCDKYFGTHEDTNKDHACDYGCSEAIGDCEDADKDHACDYGCDKVYGEHEDTNKDHACDYGCSVAIGTHADSADDKDHVCDYGCGEILEDCTWGEWVLTKAPTDAEDGTYTRVCTICDATETKSVAREDYSAYDEAIRNAEELLEDETLTEDAKNEIQNAINEAEKLDQNLPADVTEDGKTVIDNDSAEKITDAAKDLTDVLDKITNDETGAYEKPDYTDAENAITNAENIGSLTEEEESKLEELKKELEDIKNQTNPSATAKDNQADVDAIEDAAQAIVNKYADCESGNHAWSVPVLTTRPTADTKGVYTYTCTVCGATKTTEADLADYSELDSVKDELEDLLGTENLTEEAKEAIEEALNKAEALEKDLVADVTDGDGNVIIEGEQDKIDDLADELKQTISDIKDAITNGSAIYVDYDAFEKARLEYYNNTNGVATSEDKRAAAVAIGSIADLDEKSTKTGDNQQRIDEATAALEAINAKYANCAADNHNYESHVTAPTCTNKGYTTYTCTVCGDSYKDNYVDKTAHNYTSSVTAPTCTQKGYTTYLCVDCGHSYDGDYVAALGHTEIILEAVEATCSSTGLTEGSMCATCNQIVVPQKEIPKLKHTDSDNDGICDSCGASGLYDGCSCLCHNTHWFWHLIYIIIRIIWRVFNIHKECMCGAVHF